MGWFTSASNQDRSLGSNTTVDVNGGRLLVTAYDSINGKSITLGAGNSSPSLAFQGTYGDNVGARPGKFEGLVIFEIKN